MCKSCRNIYTYVIFFLFFKLLSSSFPLRPSSSFFLLPYLPYTRPMLPDMISGLTQSHLISNPLNSVEKNVLFSTITKTAHTSHTSHPSHTLFTPILPDLILFVRGKCHSSLTKLSDHFPNYSPNNLSTETSSSLNANGTIAFSQVSRFLKSPYFSLISKREIPNRLKNLRYWSIVWGCVIISLICH